MKLRVKEVRQSSSSGDHVTIFEADIDFVAGPTEVEIAATVPADADPSVVEMVREAIRLGVEDVLPRGVGAVVRVSRVVIHLVDCKPRRFRWHTSEELRRMLDEFP